MKEWLTQADYVFYGQLLLSLIFIVYLQLFNCLFTLVEYMERGEALVEKLVEA